MISCACELELLVASFIPLPPSPPLFFLQVLTELREVDVYSYVPDGPETNPFTEEETTWSMNYFFYHKRRRTIVFLYVYAAQAAHLADQNTDR
jgi:hypothetical protein